MGIDTGKQFPEIYEKFCLASKTVPNEMCGPERRLICCKSAF